MTLHEAQSGPARRPPVAVEARPSGARLLPAGAVGAVVGGLLAMLLVGLGGAALRSLFLGAVVAGLLVGAAVGGIVGSIFALPTAPAAPEEPVLGPDPLERTALPFVLVPTILLVVVLLVVGIGSLLLELLALYGKFGPVIAALIGTGAIGLGATLLASRGDQESASGPARATTSHTSH